MKNQFSDFCYFYFIELWFILFTILECFYRPNMVKSNVVSKDAQFSETDFLFVFLYDFFWDKIDFVFDVHSKLAWNIDFCEPDSDYNQRDKGSLNPKHVGFRYADPVGGVGGRRPPSIFFSSANGRFCTQSWSIFRWILRTKTSMTQKIINLKFILPVSILTSFEQIFFLVGDTLENSGVSPVNCKYNQL